MRNISIPASFVEKYPNATLGDILSLMDAGAASVTKSAPKPSVKQAKPRKNAKATTATSVPPLPAAPKAAKPAKAPQVTSAASTESTTVFKAITGGNASASAIVAATGLDKAHATKAIKELLSAGKISKHGEKRGTTYVAVNGAAN